MLKSIQGDSLSGAGRLGGAGNIGALGPLGLSNKPQPTTNIKAKIPAYFIQNLNTALRLLL